MKTHKVSIYHCVDCGRVVHAQLDAMRPQCCGRAMAKAFTETVPEGKAPGKAAGETELAKLAAE